VPSQDVQAYVADALQRHLLLSNLQAVTATPTNIPGHCQFAGIVFADSVACNI
jgi:hypothetical protein